MTNPAVLRIIVTRTGSPPAGPKRRTLGDPRLRRSRAGRRVDKELGKRIPDRDVKKNYPITFC
jgi:hypothetical protein